jgi:hypothetical protein
MALKLNEFIKRQLPKLRATVARLNCARSPPEKERFVLTLKGYQYEFISKEKAPVAMSNRYVLTLVHGTFAQNGRAKWTAAESTLVRTLNECLGTNILVCRFFWNGKNTHASRRSAGKSLAKQLKEQSGREPNASHVVIAHSHGGNILAYALSQVSLPDLIAVTLGTPFIRVNSRFASDGLWKNILTPFLMLAGSGLLLSYPFFMEATSGDDRIISGKEWTDIFVTVSSITLTAIVIIIGIFGAKHKI